jgi:hypothetical protein
MRADETGRRAAFIPAARQELPAHFSKSLYNIPCIAHSRRFNAKELAVSQNHSEETLSEPLRKEIFLALVEAQDHDPSMSIKESWKLISDKFGITVNQLRTIEREGIDQQWPPLG